MSFPRTCPPLAEVGSSYCLIVGLLHCCSHGVTLNSVKNYVEAKMYSCSDSEISNNLNINKSSVLPLTLLYT